MPYSQRAEGLDQLRRELAALPDEIVEEGEKIVGRGMLNIKRGAETRVRGLSHLPHLARSYGYDVSKRQLVIRGVGGADPKKLQGGLDSYIENGTAHNAPRRQWANALDEELPNFERYAEQYLARLLR